MTLFVIFHVIIAIYHVLADLFSVCFRWLENVKYKTIKSLTLKRLAFEKLLTVHFRREGRKSD